MLINPKPPTLYSRTAIQLAAAPTAGDQALGATAVFYDAAAPEKLFRLNVGKTAYVLAAGDGTALPVTDLATAADSGAAADAFVLPALDAAGLFKRMSLARLLAWIQGHYADLGVTTGPVILAANTVLDGSVHNRRVLVATAPLTLSAPALFANLGANFRATLIARATVTFGSGVTSGMATLTSGQWAEIVALNDGSGNLCLALTSAVSTTPAITASVSGAPFVAAGGSTVSVPVVVSFANYGAAPTVQISVDGGAFAALPGSPAVTSTGITGLAVTLGGGAHTVAIKDTGTGLVSNTAAFNVAAASLAGVPTAGWVVSTAKALTGATVTLAGIGTAYACLWDGSAEVGARQAFTSSATLAALSFTPAAANATHRIRVYTAASGGSLLAETAAFTVAAAGGGMPILAITAGSTAISSNGLYKFIACTAIGPVLPDPIAGNHDIRVAIVRNVPTGVDLGSDGGMTWSGITMPAGSDPANGTVNGVNGGFSSVTFGYNPTATGTAGTAAYAVNPPSKNVSGGLIGVLPGNYLWYSFNGAPGAASGTSLYLIVTTSDGQSCAVGPVTRA